MEFDFKTEMHASILDKFILAFHKLPRISKDIYDKSEEKLNENLSLVKDRINEGSDDDNEEVSALLINIMGNFSKDLYVFNEDNATEKTTFFNNLMINEVNNITEEFMLFVDYLDSNGFNTPYTLIALNALFDELTYYRNSTQVRHNVREFSELVDKIDVIKLFDFIRESKLSEFKGNYFNLDKVILSITNGSYSVPSLIFNINYIFQYNSIEKCKEHAFKMIEDELSIHQEDDTRIPFKPHCLVYSLPDLRLVNFDLMKGFVLSDDDIERLVHIVLAENESNTCSELLSGNYFIDMEVDFKHSYSKSTDFMSIVKDIILIISSTFMTTDVISNTLLSQVDNALSNMGVYDYFSNKITSGTTTRLSLEKVNSIDPFTTNIFALLFNKNNNWFYDQWNGKFDKYFENPISRSINNPNMDFSTRDGFNLFINLIEYNVEEKISKIVSAHNPLNKVIGIIDMIRCFSKKYTRMLLSEYMDTINKQLNNSFNSLRIRFDNELNYVEIDGKNIFLDVDENVISGSDFTTINDGTNSVQMINTAILVMSFIDKSECKDFDDFIQAYRSITGDTNSLSEFCEVFYLSGEQKEQLLNGKHCRWIREDKTDLFKVGDTDDFISLMMYLHFNSDKEIHLGKDRTTGTIFGDWYTLDIHKMEGTNIFTSTEFYRDRLTFLLLYLHDMMDKNRFDKFVPSDTLWETDLLISKLVPLEVYNSLDVLTNHISNYINTDTHIYTKFYMNNTRQRDLKLNPLTNLFMSGSKYLPTHIRNIITFNVIVDDYSIIPLVKQTVLTSNTLPEYVKEAIFSKIGNIEF